MLTATQMLNYIGWIYIFAAACCVLLAWKLPLRKRSKVSSAFVTLLLFVIWPATSSIQDGRQREIQSQKLQLAKERFNELCKKAGAKIYRVVDNVEGILLANVRPSSTPSDRSDPNWPDAALPDEGREEWYIKTFLFWEHRQDARNPRGYLNNEPSSLPGYRFVDIADETGGFVRYRLQKPERIELTKEVISRPGSQYLVIYSNEINPEERKYWIASTTVEIFDNSTKELLAEHKWFSMDIGQGNTTGFRAPWGFAKTCPFGATGFGVTRMFVDQVLRPSKEKAK